MREYNDFLESPSRTNRAGKYMINKILSRTETTTGVEYLVQWAGFSRAQATLVTKEALFAEVARPRRFFRELDETLQSGDDYDASIDKIDMGAPPSAWRWRCAWMHLVAPRDVNGFQNKHLKLSDRCGYFLHNIVAPGMAARREDDADDTGTEGEAATRRDYNTSSDHNSGMPRCLSFGIQALLDGGKPPGVGTIPQLPSMYTPLGTTETAANESTAPNPYELLLSTSGGQHVELSTLSSYLGTGVHVASAVAIKNAKQSVGDGFSGPNDNLAKLRTYVGTLPRLCRDLADTTVTNLADSGGIQSVETVLHWSFGLTKDDKFVVTRADATGVSGSRMVVHEFKSKWTVSDNRALDFKKKPLPRDLRQTVLNGLMLALVRGATVPDEDIELHVHYIKPRTTDPASEPASVTHVTSLGAVSTRGVRYRLAKVAAMKSVSRCRIYVDTQFVVKDIASVVETLKAAKPTPENGTDPVGLGFNLDLVRLACQGRPIRTYQPLGHRVTNENDKGWWVARNDGVREKRPQMGQKWRGTHGLPFLQQDNEAEPGRTQTHHNRLKGGAPNSDPPSSDNDDDIKKATNELDTAANTLVARIDSHLQNMTDGAQKRAILAALARYPLGIPGPEATAGIVSNAVRRGINAVSIGVLDLKHVSERTNTTQQGPYPTRRSDYEDAVNTGLRNWWNVDVLKHATTLLNEHVATDMAVITGA